jgi:hypothetical protein
MATVLQNVIIVLLMVVTPLLPKNVGEVIMLTLFLNQIHMTLVVVMVTVLE